MRETGLAASFVEDVVVDVDYTGQTTQRLGVFQEVPDVGCVSAKLVEQVVFDSNNKVYIGRVGCRTISVDVEHLTVAPVVNDVVAESEVVKLIGLLVGKLEHMARMLSHCILIDTHILNHTMLHNEVLYDRVIGNVIGVKNQLFERQVRKQAVTNVESNHDRVDPSHVQRRVSSCIVSIIYRLGIKLKSFIEQCGCLNSVVGGQASGQDGILSLSILDGEVTTCLREGKS
ncbi:MAG: hypothetical protein BWY95_02005 [Bacteroidetes bacterium ADurb.BinA104]|nr:MAG: hypothetical protein BWY95_02005 [Bacteroidetes bacterium ADurb.BinA104]